MQHFAMRDELILLVPWNYSLLINTTRVVVCLFWGCYLGMVIPVDDGLRAWVEDSSI